MADRHTAQSVLAALRARERTVSEVAVIDKQTIALADGVRLKFTAASCDVDGWTVVPLGVCSPCGQTVERIDTAIAHELARREVDKQRRAFQEELRRRADLAASLSGLRVTVDAHATHDGFTVHVERVTEAELSALVEAIRASIGESPSGGDEP